MFLYLKKIEYALFLVPAIAVLLVSQIPHCPHKTVISPIEKTVNFEEEVGGHLQLLNFSKHMLSNPNIGHHVLPFKILLSAPLIFPIAPSMSEH